MAFRVVLHWTVKPGRFEEFASVWAEATEAIREHRAGALGSELCRLDDESDTAIAIAHWESRRHWHESESIATTHPDIANRMSALADLTGREGCDVVDSRVGPLDGTRSVC